MSMLTIMGMDRSAASALVLIYGTLQWWRRRRRGPTPAAREASTRELYRESTSTGESGKKIKFSPRFFYAYDLRACG